MTHSSVNTRIIAGLTVGFLFAFGLLAQEFRSTITGQITDPSGAVVPKATVTAVNSESGQKYTVTTTDKGAYYIPYVLPGTYSVTASAPGFRTKRQENVLLQASQSSGLNFSLELGQATQTVTVSSAPPLIETETGSGGTVLSERELQNVPLNGRQIYTLIGTTPGSQFTQTQFGSGGFSGTRGWDVTNEYTIGGGVQGYQQFTLNGTNITQQSGGSFGTWELAPNVDALQEVNVMTTTYDARYGRTGGGTVNMVVKSGTNAYHGDFYEYLENGALDANNFENNLNGQPRQDLHQNQFGGVIGGPVKKDKIFFFGSFEGYKEGIPFTTVTSVPPAYLRPSNGSGVDFTQTGYTIFDPSTTTCATAGGTIGNCPNNNYARQEFPGDTIPASRISSIGANVLNLYPLPNAGSGLQNNYIANVPDKYDYWQPMVRVDYDTSDKTRWYSMFAFQHGTEFRNSSGFPSPAENGNINQMRQELMASQDMTHIFTPTLLGDFKISFSRFIQEAPNGDLSSSVTPQSLGLNGMIHAPTTSLNLLPEFFTLGTQNGGFYPQIVGNQTSTAVYNNIVFDTDFTKTLSTHTIHFGGEIAEFQYGNPNSVGSPNGQFTFGARNTQYNPTQGNTLAGINDGFSVADMLLGYPVSNGGTSFIDYDDTQFEGTPTYAIYAQDDWKITHRLTMNIGLRYDVQRGTRERYNRLNQGMCLSCVNPVTNDPAYQANLSTDSAALTAAGVNLSGLETLHGGILFPGQGGRTRDAYYTDWTNIQPRIGFAYQIDNKTVLRGGYGIFYSVGLESGTNIGYSLSTPYIDSINGGITPTNYFQSGTPFPTGLQVPPGSSGGLLTAVGSGQSLDFPQRRIPRSQEFSFGFQRQFASQFVLDARYAGNYTDRLRTANGTVGNGSTIWLNGTLDLAQLEQGVANPNLFNQQVPNPFYGVPSVPVSSTCGSNPTISAIYLMLPYQQYCGLIGQYNDPLGKNWYNALEVKLTKRYSAGLSLQASYTYSKTMNAMHYNNGWPYQDPNLLREISPYDRTHVFSLTGGYDLPFGKGRAFASNTTGVVNQLVSGWSVNWILSVQTGFPVGLNPGYYDNCNHSYTPNGGPSLSNYLYNNYSSGNPLGCWSTIPQYGLMNLPDQIATLRQPSVPNLDLSVMKNFPITERWKAQLRADALNLTNSVLFPGPDNNPSDGPPVHQSNGTYTGFGTVNLDQQNFPRIVQVSLKFFF